VDLVSLSPSLTNLALVEGTTDSQAKQRFVAVAVAAAAAAARECGWMYGWVDRWMDVWMDGWVM